MKELRNSLNGIKNIIIYNKGMDKVKVSVFGLGYVGLANALLLSQKEQVKAYDIVEEKIDMLQQKNHRSKIKKCTNFLNEMS
ncbi:hypothetical protein SMS_02125 [Enterococcus faecium EnGen0184]|nr:hypothetical protein SMS_02125 [Enterococcus faecium EnGen0184]